MALATHCSGDRNFQPIDFKQGTYDWSTCGNGNQSTTLVHGMYGSGAMSNQAL